MKIVIVSDTHGSRKNIENVCECNPDAEIWIIFQPSDNRVVSLVSSSSLIHISLSLFIMPICLLIVIFFSSYGEKVNTHSTSS